MHDVKIFFHEASHHVMTLYALHLYRTAHGYAVNEALADIAAVELSDVQRGVGWSLIEEVERGRAAKCASTEAASVRQVYIVYAEIPPRAP